MGNGNTGKLQGLTELQDEYAKMGSKRSWFAEQPIIAQLGASEWVEENSIQLVTIGANNLHIKVIIYC